jgi:hypothetical protein
MHIAINALGVKYAVVEALRASVRHQADAKMAG